MGRGRYRPSVSGLPEYHASCGGHQRWNFQVQNPPDPPWGMRLPVLSGHMSAGAGLATRALCPSSHCRACAAVADTLHPVPVQGNCADADAAAALSLSAADASDLLPLKPRQCLLLFDDTWLIVSSSSLWLDNLYLKLGSRARLPHGSFVRVGLPTESGSVAVSAVAAAPDVAEAGVRIY